MLKEWIIKEFPDGIIFDGYYFNKIREFLILNKETEFSDQDIKFFIGHILSNSKLRICFTDFFLSNEKRILDTIQICKEIQYYNEIVIFAIESAIMRGRGISQKFLFKNFPLELFDATSLSKSGSEAFYLLCYSFQNKEFLVEGFKYFIGHFNSPDIFLERIQKNLPPAIYFSKALPLLLGSDAVKCFLVNQKTRLLKKIKSIIKTKDIFCRVKHVKEIIRDIYYLREEVNKNKENYTIFVLKKIILFHYEVK